MTLPGMEWKDASKMDGNGGKARRGVLNEGEMDRMVQSFQTQSLISKLRKELEVSKSAMHHSEDMLRRLMPHAL